MSVVDGGLQVVVSCVGRSGGLYGSTFSGCATLRGVTFPDDAHLLSGGDVSPRQPGLELGASRLDPHLTPPLPASRSTAEGAVVFAYATALPMRVRDGALALTAMDAAIVSFRSNGTIARCLPPTQQQFLAELGAAIS